MHKLSSLKPWLAIIARQRGRLFVGGALMLATFLSALGLMALSGWFITATAIAGMAAIAYLDVFTPGAGIRGLAVGRTVSRYFERLYNHNTVLRLLASLRVSVYESLLSLKPNQINQMRASQWLQRLTADIDTLDNLYLRLLAPPFTALIGLLAFTLFSLIFQPTVALFLAITLLLVWLFATLGCGYLGWAQSHKKITVADGLRVRTAELLNGMSELTLYQSYADHLALWKKQQAALTRNQLSLLKRLALSNAIVSLSVQLITLSVLLIATSAAVTGVISWPVVVMLTIGCMALSEGLANLPAAFIQLGGSVRAAERLNSLNESITNTHQRSIMPADQSAPRIQLSQVCLSYDQHRIFEDVSFAIPAGQRLAIIGESGIGKTSIAQAILGFLDPVSGTICFNNYSIADVTSASLRSHCGYLTQQHEILQDTLAFNLRLGDPLADDEALWSALRSVDLEAWAKALPQGLNTWLGELGKTVSGGQARRIALARVMLRNSPFVILDEPLRGLDFQTAEVVKSHLDQWLCGRTALLLGHSHDALPAADIYLRIIAATDGGKQLIGE